MGRAPYVLYGVNYIDPVSLAHVSGKHKAVDMESPIMKYEIMITNSTGLVLDFVKIDEKTKGINREWRETNSKLEAVRACFSHMPYYYAVVSYTKAYNATDGVTTGKSMRPNGGSI